MKFVVLALLGLVAVSAEEPVAAPESAVTTDEDLDDDFGAIAEDDDGVPEQEEGAFNLAEEEKKPKKKGKKSKSKGKGKGKGKKKGSKSKGKKAKKTASAAAPIIPNPSVKGGNPDSNRKVFEQHVAFAGQVVRTQEAFEKKKTAEIDAANNKAIKEANDLKTKVRKAADNNMMGKTPADASKQLWTGPEFVQIKEEPAAAPKAEAPKDEAPKQAAPEEKPVASTAKVGTPQYTYESKAKALQNSSSTVSQQQAEESEFLKAHKADSDKLHADTEA